MSPADAASAALEALIARCAEKVRIAARTHRLDPADLDDVFQEVRIRVWKAVESGERIADLSASYVYRAAMSAAVDLLRRRHARRDDVATPLELTDPSELAAPEANPLDLADLGTTIEDALADIVPTRRPVVRLYLEGYDASEIAGLMGWTEGKARNLLSRGLAELRGALQRRGVGPEGVR